MYRNYVFRFPLRLHWFILCTRRSGGTAHEGGGCDQSIRSTVSEAIIRSWLWSTETRSSQLSRFSRLLQVVDNWPHILWWWILHWEAPGHRRHFVVARYSILRGWRITIFIVIPKWGCQYTDDLISRFWRYSVQLWHLWIHLYMPF